MRVDLNPGMVTLSRGRLARAALALGVLACCLSAQHPPRQDAIDPDVRAALERVSADSMRGHLSFIASDALEGRDTPSRGLDIAAEYIAAQFRRAGLEPAGDDDFFQSANFVLAETPMDAFELKITTGTETISVAKNRVSFAVNRAMNVSASTVRIDYADAAAVAALKREEVEGKAVITELPVPSRADEANRFEVFQAREQFIRKIAALNAAVVLSIDRVATTGRGAGQGRLIDPGNRLAPAQAQGIAVITVHDSRVVKLYDEMKPGPARGELSLRVPAPVERPVRLRNVIGLLRGSDPILKDTYVLLTAHYDHIGIRPEIAGDKIFNGANDDGSGTVSVIELASALSALKQRPKRSIVFMTFFGEEKGLLGSRYYGRHPVYAIDKTVADINLEQVGRTDSSEGSQLANASVTGFDYSEVGTILQAAGKSTGIEVYKHAANSDSFFARSDNQALADQGVPAHTLCTAFVYPDYHGAGDHWDKIDYSNMEKVDRMVALALIVIANNPRAPAWNEANPRTTRYVRAWNEHHGK